MIIGVDEVNFSPSLAGDCVVCALVRCPRTRKVPGVKDSKQLIREQKIKLFNQLQKRSLYSVVPATVNDINSMGIYLARNYAIQSAVNHLLIKLEQEEIYQIEKIIIDGYFSKDWLSHYFFEFIGNLSIPKGGVECLVNGDQKVYEISAASIVARVYADALFSGFGEFYPGYNLEKCHGSPDKTMYAKLRESGPTPYHRTNYGLGWWEKIIKGKRRDG